ncbi:phage terminase large subunit [Flavobacterium sp. 25HG05S-40]|uniref:phage terminase large subunit n=1 Tax=Flavobacterium sp. 25HG05S-40 TaxID=3458682 RepID=UPI0040439F0C
MQPQEKEIDVLVHQAEFLESDERHTALIAGYGSGKTQAGILKVVKKKLEYPGIAVAYYMPTYGLIEDVAYERFEEIMKEMGCGFRLDKSKHTYYTPYGKIIMRSLMNPDRIVGYEVGYSLIDETDLLSTDNMDIAFKKIIARNRKKLPNGDTNKTDVVGTPEGFKWAYKFFVSDNKPNRRIIKGKTKDNPFLPDDYIETLQDSYTPQQLEAYLNGEFVNLTTGNVYHRFDRKANHTNRTVQANDVLHIGMDFNVTKMNAVVHVVDEKEVDWFSAEKTIIKKKVRIKSAVDEFVNAYDTAELIGLIKSKYSGYKIIIYPDASGDNRVSSGRSDIDLLKAANFVVRKLSKNPFVKDRVNSMNLAFLDANGNKYYYCNTDQCPVYTEALEKQTYKNGEPDKKSGFDHITEAGGYFVYYDSKPTGTWGKSSTN